MERVANFAAELHTARRTGRTLESLLSQRGLDSLADAYAVQRALTSLRVAHGEQVVGWKLGYTSAAMRAQMGIGEPNFGPLTDAMRLTGAGVVPAAALQPRAEPEIALVLDRPVPPDADVATVLTCCRSAHACVEVVDSVWAGYRFTLLDNTADGSSAGWFVLGDEVPLEGLADLEVRLSVDGRAVGSATGAAAGGHPAVGVAWLGGQLAGERRGLAAGDVVLTGGLTAAVALDSGSSIEARCGPASRAAWARVSRWRLG